MSINATWLGHATFTINLPDGRVLLIDPWVANNPACPDELKSFDRVDVVAITHGHFDHIADAVPVCQQYQPQVYCIFEIGEWLGRKGVENINAMNKGGTLDLGGVKLTMVHADHSCGITDDDGSIVYGGEAVGFVLSFDGGPTLYHAGDTAVFGDMALIAELYQPTVAMLPIGDRFTMSPYEAAKSVELLGVNKVIPMHYGTFPLLTGTPEMLEQELSKRGVSAEVWAVSPGETFPL